MVFKRKKTHKPKYTRYSSYRRKGTRKFKSRSESKVARAVFSRSFQSIRKLLFYVILLGFVPLTIYYILFSGKIIVEDTGLFENDVRIDHDIILSEINIYKGEPLLSVNKTELAQELRAKYPEIQYL